ncbi:hypothetical protein D9V32_08085 [Mycetocola tolaasinivorans]|uniref:Uncharacterized protein n=1 Tax=Mycetocola tolaasinivorans TaxID=76635 RepID=A0A3L7A7P2_9MICO|nr:hypothetical protein [Mycetocola tolaasinivorans]RLP76105.1 hypothetical protein D9V32_08085 [Mycetocola tolaasinivorans]
MSPRTPRSAAKLSTVHLGTGLALAGAVIVVVSYLRLLEYWSGYLVSLPTRFAWILLGSVLVGIVLHLRRTSARLGPVAFRVIVAFLLAAAALDFAGVWDISARQVYPTAAVAVGGVLVALTTLRPTGEMIVPGALLAGGFTFLLIFQTAFEPHRSPPEGVMMVFALVPLAIAITIVGTYRRMVTQALDRVLLQSTIELPSYGPGLGSTAQLTALDREVEELFARVADGTLTLPLEAEQARRAGELATELRAHLIAGHQQSWLVHAIAESAVLAGKLKVIDPQRLAAKLDRDRRDGLLSALWLLAVTDGDTNPRGTVEFQEEASPDGQITLVIIISVDGLTRLEIEPATWAGLDRVGRYGVSNTITGVRIAVRGNTPPSGPTRGHHEP